jgi:hypothetical protein
MNSTGEQNAIYGQARTVVNDVQVSTSAVSWGAIFAGAATAAALSLILLILGSGLGFSAVSPWADQGVSATTFGVSTIIWLILTQLLAAGMGGYLAGRLRTKWTELHSDEVYFRDTAHGFLAWAIASLATAALLSSVIGSIVSSGVQAGASVASGVATTALVASAGAAAGSGMATEDTDNGGMGYFLDALFRRDINAYATPRGSQPSQQETAASMAEVSRIFMNSIRTGALPAEDARYVGQVVAQRTGLTQQEAEQRVNEAFARFQDALSEAETTAREAADSVRKASAYSAIWMFVALLIGAFAASFAATYGGRQRDA